MSKRKKGFPDLKFLSICPTCVWQRATAAGVCKGQPLVAVAPLPHPTASSSTREADWLVGFCAIKLGSHSRQGSFTSQL